ncbi:preprotein translocase, SecG subunit [Neorickettsia helminthoeca str. Oregon]|uniref:Protein-export membrane protein SecG n=1 Tax=Neorickettsia helminthoeca str. Oregon TaxID=1286528 RepID=X5HKY3_9RICK|nr:preprotein translocase subunit SecG [Neorickettsia helminthoeca]AHX11754.1 preprotein translocase, SecG subunit [Neorickettsia helminthoeca str. Oregon]
MLFLIVLQFVVAVLLVLLVLFQNSGSSVTGAFASKHGGMSTVGGVSGLAAKITWVLLFVFFLNTVLLGRLNFSSNVSTIANEVEEGAFKRTLEARLEQSKDGNSASG